MKNKVSFTDPVFKYRGLSDFQKVLFLEHQVKGLISVLKDKDDKIREIELANTDSEKVKRLRNTIEQLTNSNASNKRKRIAASNNLRSVWSRIDLIKSELLPVLSLNGPRLNKDETRKMIAAIYNINLIIKNIDVKRKN